MNRLPVKKILDLSGKVAMVTGANRGLGKALRPHLERNLEIGLRPEHLVVGEGSDVAEPARFQAKVEFVEPMGGETLIFLTINEVEICAKCSPNLNVKPGDVMTFTADMTHMHLIDPETGGVILNTDSN